MRFDEDPFTWQCKKKKTKKAERCQILRFYWVFSSHVMAVKGLKFGVLGCRCSGHAWTVWKVDELKCILYFA